MSLKEKLEAFKKRLSDNKNTFFEVDAELKAVEEQRKVVEAKKRKLSQEVGVPYYGNDYRWYFPQSFVDDFSAIAHFPYWEDPATYSPEFKEAFEFIENELEEYTDAFNRCEYAGYWEPSTC